MGEPGGLTLGGLWARTSDVLGARHEARWLCEVASGLDGAEFETALDEPATTGMIGHLDAMVARYRAGEPIQYVLGRWGFRRLDLAIDRRVLIPRPETELVAEVAIALARSVPAPRHVADLGTGSGAIGLSLAVELPIDGTTVVITDVDPDALALARANLAGIGRAARNVRVAAGSWYDALPDDIRFDVIVANPPYVAERSPDLAPSVRDWEPAIALFSGPDGLDDLRHLIAGAEGHLARGGWLVLEIGADQGGHTRGLLAEAAFDHIEIRTDLAGHDRIAVGRRPR